MSVFSNWDFLYILRQSALLALYPVVPLLAFAIIGRRRYLWSWCGCAYLGTLVLAMITIFFTSYGLYESGLPYAPFRVGPSDHSIVDLFFVFVVTLWIPALAVAGILVVVLKYRKKANAITLAMLMLTAYFAVVGAVWTVSIFYNSGYLHEDTVWSKDFSFDQWNTIEEGMTRRLVLTRLGQPLPSESVKVSTSQSDILLWADCYSAGYRAEIEFVRGKVAVKKLGFSENRAE